MHFEPVLIKNIFSIEDRNKLIEVLKTSTPNKNWLDPDKNREVKKYTELETYFSKKLEPLARQIFKDSSLKTSYSVYLNYNKPTSSLPPHKDNNACTYTIDYCVSQKTPWPLIIEGKEFQIPENAGLAFMGGHDMHSRGDMPSPDTNVVETIMFHFCPGDHWYFTEGPEYGYYLLDNNLLENSESYYLSPKKKPKGDRLYL
jgi:hypothetical protein